VSTFFQELRHTGIYKRNQGRITRQVTFAAVAIAGAVGLYRLSLTLIGYGRWAQIGAPLVLLLLGLWAAYRLVNVPGFADFLIAVEAEMNKVSWPSRGELYRASVIVLITIFSLAAILAGFDFFWRFIFTKVLGIL